MTVARGELVVGVRAVGLLGPGLCGWPAGAAVLGGRAAYAPAATLVPIPAVLSAAERRRAGRVLRLAIGVATEAAGADAEHLATVFASSGGDGENCHVLCVALATPARELSPTRFMNSVHNAAAGYWSLAAHSPRPATALCAHDGSFSAGLLEAATQVRSSGEAVLLVAYDANYPEPLNAARPMPDAFATALLLAPDTTDALASLVIGLTQAPASTLSDPALESLRRSIPAARSLPLLTLLASSATGDCALDYLTDLRIGVRVSRC